MPPMTIETSRAFASAQRPHGNGKTRRRNLAPSKTLGPVGKFRNGRVTNYPASEIRPISQPFRYH